MTAVYPYAKAKLNDRVEASVVLGAGQGELAIDEDGGKPLTTDLGMTMGAVGMAGELLKASDGHPIDLRARSDAMWARMESDALSGDDGNLAAAKADVTRVRLILEAERGLALEGGNTLTPSVELGLRHDGGDAEHGLGLEAGGGLKYVGTGFSVEGRARALVAHESSGYEEWGASGTVRIDPGASGRGLSLSISPTWGSASSGVERLWSLEDASRLEPGREFEPRSQLDAELGYGIGLRGAPGVLTPYAGLSLGDGGSRTYRAGGRWNVGPGASVALEGRREESRSAGESNQAIELRTALRW